MPQKYKTLADYFDSTKKKYGPFAEELGISESYVSLLVTGNRQPSLPLALRIHELTGVPVAALVSEAKAS